MDEMSFRKWLREQNYTKKLISDTVSRLKRIERECNYCDLDVEYNANQCEKLLALFKNKGVNDEMASLGTPNLPINKKGAYVYKYALSLYIKFKDNANLTNPF